MSNMSREERMREIERWAVFDLDNDNNRLEEYYEQLEDMDDKTFDDEYDATVGEWKRSLDDEEDA
jgi:hypothetical protein